MVGLDNHLEKYTNLKSDNLYLVGPPGLEPGTNTL